MKKIRVAEAGDIPAIECLIRKSAGAVFKSYLSPEEVDAAVATIGVDRQIIDDGTYFLLEIDDRLAACGGWSWRKTIYGGMTAPHRDNRKVDPLVEPARIRAMFTHPDFLRRGLGRHLLQHCEAEAMKFGFSSFILG